MLHIFNTIVSMVTATESRNLKNQSAPKFILKRGFTTQLSQSLQSLKEGGEGDSLKVKQTHQLVAVMYQFVVCQPSMKLSEDIPATSCHLRTLFPVSSPLTH